MEKTLPKMLSKSMVSPETSLRKSKKRAAIASAACEALGSCWLAEGSSGRALGALGRCWEAWDVFFSENKPPEGAFHRQTMLVEGLKIYTKLEKKSNIYIFKIYRCIFSENKSLLLQILVMAQQKPSKINPRRLKMKVRGSPSKINI